MQTGMGQSFDLASKSKSSADFSAAKLYDKHRDLHYEAFWKNDSLYMHEYRLNGKDSSHNLIRQVNYIIGSGQHTNSHLWSSNAYLCQMPMTFYTQKKKWDMPPGFENGMNTRFSRKIGLECMTCHNAYPHLVLGSENKYDLIPRGIDCERCHGPGSIHASQRSTGSRIDTSKFIDYSIVNPAKLPIDLQFDICQRCHLQGNTVLQEGKTFYDFKPGQALSKTMSVFLPRYANAEDEFIMASHADRLKESRCFKVSYEKRKNRNALKPYQEALTCVSCHNPHKSVKQTKAAHFNGVCLQCHGGLEAQKKVHAQVQNFSRENCFDCHMPGSGSTDIPHVMVHDHRIAKPINRSDKEKIRTFLGLISVNEKQPSDLTRARAYLNQYDKFEQNPVFLDSSEFYLNRCPADKPVFHTRIQLLFTKGDYTGILKLLKANDEDEVRNTWLNRKSYDNQHAWTAYRIAEAKLYAKQAEGAITWFRKAVELAPYILDFRNKLGTALAQNGNTPDALAQYRFILSENPNYGAVYSNLGFLMMKNGRMDSAEKLMKKGLQLEPDNESLLLNLTTYYLQTGNATEARKCLERVLKINPSNIRARQTLNQIVNKT